MPEQFIMTTNIQRKKFTYISNGTKFCVLIIVSTIILLFGCGGNKHINNFLATDSKIKKKLLTQIDSVYSTDTSLSCMKFGRIVSCVHSDVRLLEQKLKFIIKVENRCKTWEYFYFNEDLKVVMVVHELPPHY